MRLSNPMIKLLCVAVVFAGIGYGINRVHAEDQAAAAPATEATTEAKPEEAAPAAETPAAEAATEEKKDATAAPQGDLLKFIEGDHILGNVDAPVQIIEYASLSCTHCAHFANDTMPVLEEKYIKTGKVKLMFRHFPFNEPALRGAMLAECAGNEKFWTYLKVMFRSQEKWAFSDKFMTDLKTLAKVGGLGEEKFDACMKDKKLEDRILAGVNWANERLKVASTPTFFVNNEMVQGFRSAEAMSEIIDKKLKEAGVE